MRKRSSGISQLAPDRWAWWAVEEWEQGGSSRRRSRSGTDSSKGEAELSARSAMARWETEELSPRE